MSLCRKLNCYTWDLTEKNACCSARRHAWRCQNICLIYGVDTGMTGGTGLHSGGRSSLQTPECEMEASSLVGSGAWCGIETVSDRAGEDTRSHTPSRQNEQSTSPSCLLVEVTNSLLLASPLPFPIPGDTFDTTITAAGNRNAFLTHILWGLDEARASLSTPQTRDRLVPRTSQ